MDLAYVFTDLQKIVLRIYKKGNTLIQTLGQYFEENVARFKKKGYDVKDAEYQKYYVSKIPVSVVDSIEEEIFLSNRNEILSWASKYGVKLTEYQADALTDISYQYGVYGDGGIDQVIKTMSVGGTVTQWTAIGFSNDISYEYDRGNRRWILFSQGRYLDAYGNPL